ncbi:MAG: hypothetical protein U0T36_11220 [Saprospiraceae bacterium]
MITSQFPAPFEDQMKTKLMIDYIDFCGAMDSEVPVSIRTHPYKNLKPINYENVPWCPFGYYLPSRPVFTLDPAFHSGAYYVQEASSMFIWHILNSINKESTDIKILDLCAAPGGKSSLIATFLNHKGLLVANEVVKSRAYTLKYNLSKEGYSNIIVTNSDPKDFSLLHDFFDIILVDAPCSGEGMFRKDPNAIKEWSPENVKHCAIRQQNIINDILPALKEDGHLIYSTCTYNDIENMQNVAHIVNRYDLQSIPITLHESWSIDEMTKANCVGYQFYPHKAKGEGFFIALMQKTNRANGHQKLKISDKLFADLDTKSKQIVEGWVKIANKVIITDKVGMVHLFPEDYILDAKILGSYLRIIATGTSLGTINKHIFIPDHGLALSLDLSDKVATIDLDLKNALLYLKRELSHIDSTQTSWLLATYEGQGMGWLKNLGHRINNYLPSEYRILMDLPKE